ncbi:PREDICTED: mitochondrial ribosome-associated GTPase 1 [Galeopterus variegatus]|uniref:Mitochondrial ribosome-associated GTPase 1 n=1 Tax=Galeopterus variegatus TaxID=482537 RepID=A0ABM0S9I8_GALVR|nr:PREDICTED: mitochondrial ribosome-associated GTPase 1 [Galeopterus variegatus]
MQSSLKLVDCIIEVHDARIPLSGRNPLFQETLGLKPHLLVLNKKDLADLTEQQKIIQHLEGEGLKNVIFTNCIKDENVKQVGFFLFTLMLLLQYIQGIKSRHTALLKAEPSSVAAARQPVCRYVQHYGLGGACDDIEHVLKHVAIKLGKTQKVKVLTGTGDVNVIQPNYPAAAQDFLRTFRSGLLGPVMLDHDILQGHPSAKANS